MTLRVAAAGPGCLLTDAGRPGLAALGVGPSGAADRSSYEAGNRVLANPAGAASLEILLGGLELVAEAGGWVCLTGAAAPLVVAGRHRPCGQPVWMGAGQRLVVGVPWRGARSYLAVRGGLELPPVLGSRSTDTLSGLGPAPVRPGDLLAVGPPVGPPAAMGWDVGAPDARAGAGVVHLRVRRGPHDDRLLDADLLVSTPWEVAGDSDRVGVRLQPLDGGPVLRHVPGRGELPSEGVTRGTVQVPPDGRPVVLGADHPVTGGYPVAGVVLDGDTDLLAQVRPGDQIALRWS